MVEEAKKFVYFKRNVGYSVAIRYHARDNQGFVLNNVQPWVAIPENMIRDFKMANKSLIMEGKIIEMSEEPNVDWVTPNALTEESMDELLKSYQRLKSSLEDLNSAAIVAKLLDRAKEQNKPIKTINLIQSKLEELSEDDLIIDREEMRGVSS